MAPPVDPKTALNVALQADATQKWLQALVPQTFAKYLTPERLVRITMNAVSKSPILLQCTRHSIIKSVAELATLGLEPCTPLGEGYLVPFKNKNKSTDQWEWQAQAIIGYRGYITLFRRSGLFRNVCANAVYARDRFEIDLANNEHPSHRPQHSGDRGEIICAYSVAEYTDGGLHKDFMTCAQIDHVRDLSPAGKNEHGPWANHYDEMCRKTVIRRASKYWPLTVEIANAMQLDDGEHETIIDQKFEMPDLPEVRTEALKEATKTDDVLKQVQENQKASVAAPKNEQK